jgi:hypothetical protein
VLAGPANLGLGVSFVKPSQARTLCGQSLDWIEAVR